MKIDAHQHFWVYNEEELGWLDESMATLRRDFLPGNLEHSLRSRRYNGCVAVQAAQTVRETEFLLGLADENLLILGVVGWVDLASDMAEEQLERFSTNPKFKGVRHVVQAEPEGFMLQPSFLRGIGLLEQFELTYDILVYPWQMEEAYELAGRFPNQMFVIDHMAKPAIKDHLMEPWTTDMRRLASLDNVWCKLSGLVTEADTSDWTVGDFEPYVELVLNEFDADRVMVGSDWPVCLVGGTYDDVMESYEFFGELLPSEDRDRLLGGTAAEFYSLE